MKSYALSRGFQVDRKYLISRLPKMPFEDCSLNFDVFTLLRYSIGYLSKSSAYELVKWCKEHSSVHGVSFIEVHKPSTISSIDNNFELAYREFDSDLGIVSCYWPNGKLAYSEQAWEVTMPIKITIGNDSYEYESKELIHTYEDIKFISKCLGCEAEIVSAEKLSNFSQESLIILVRLLE